LVNQGTDRADDQAGDDVGGRRLGRKAPDPLRPGEVEIDQAGKAQAAPRRLFVELDGAGLVRPRPGADEPPGQCLPPERPGPPGSPPTAVPGPRPFPRPARPATAERSGPASRRVG